MPLYQRGRGPSNMLTTFGLTTYPALSGKHSSSLLYPDLGVKIALPSKNVSQETKQFANEIIRFNSL